MKKILGLMALFVFLGATYLHAQIIKGAGTIYFSGVPNVNAALPNGSEICFSISEKKLYRWDRDLNSWQVIGSLNTEEAQDLVGAMLTGGSQSNITVSYNDVAGTIDLSVPVAVTDLTYTGASGTITLNSSNGTDVNFVSGTGIGLNRSGVNLTISTTAVLKTGAFNDTPNVAFWADPNTITGDDGFEYYQASNTLKISSDDTPNEGTMIVGNGNPLFNTTSPGVHSQYFYARGGNFESWDNLGGVAATNQYGIINTLGIAHRGDLEIGSPAGTITGFLSGTRAFIYGKNPSSSSTYGLQVQNSNGTGNYLTVRDDGRVGILTASPGATLHVAGTVLVSSSGSTATGLLARDASNILTGVTLGTGMTLSGGTLSAVDPAPTNEIQQLAHTSDATSHTATLSLSGGSIKFVEGSNITLTTSGTSTDGIVTIATAPGVAYTNWGLRADAGTSQDINSGDQVVFAGGYGINTLVSDTDNLRIEVDTTQVATQYDLTQVGGTNIYNSNGTIASSTNRVVSMSGASLLFDRDNYDFGYYTDLASTGTGIGWGLKYVSGSNLSQVYNGTISGLQANGIYTQSASYRAGVYNTLTSSSLSTVSVSTSDGAGVTSAIGGITAGYLTAGSYTTGLQFLNGSVKAFNTNTTTTLDYPVSRPGAASFWRYNADGTGQYVAVSTLTTPNTIYNANDTIESVSRTVYIQDDLNFKIVGGNDGLFINPANGNYTIGSNTSTGGQVLVNTDNNELTLRGSTTLSMPIKIYEGTSNGTNYTNIKGANSLSANWTLTLPDNDGNAGNILTNTDGAGTLSWATGPGTTIANSYNTTTSAGGSVAVTLSGTPTAGYCVVSGNETSGAALGYIYNVEFTGGTGATVRVFDTQAGTGCASCSVKFTVICR